MKILVLNGNPDAQDVAFDGYVRDLAEAWQAKNHHVHVFELRSMHIESCTGCWSCWWKTPGLCATKDDGDAIRGAYLHADLVWFASPLRVGFLSALLKDVMDKLIPLAHPYITLIDGECIHRKRYDRLPMMGGLLAMRDGAEDEDVRVVDQYLRRTAYHFQSRFLATFRVDQPLAEVVHAIDRV